MRKDKHYPHEVTFNADEFFFDDSIYKVTGITGIDIDSDKIQIRDDILILKKGGKIFLSFEEMMNRWDELAPHLINIVKRGGFLRKM